MCHFRFGQLFSGSGMCCFEFGHVPFQVRAHRALCTPQNISGALSTQPPSISGTPSTHPLSRSPRYPRRLELERQGHQPECRGCANYSCGAHVGAFFPRLFLQGAQRCAGSWDARGEHFGNFAFGPTLRLLIAMSMSRTRGGTFLIPN
jgi:hypothetical protein